MKAKICGMLMLATLAAGSAFGYVQDSDYYWQRRAQARERATVARERARERREFIREDREARRSSLRVRTQMRREELRARRDMRREMRREFRHDWGRVY